MVPPVKSTVWNQFIKVPEGGRCKLCLAVVKTKGNTTNLSRHLQRHHPITSTAENVEKSNKKMTDSIQPLEVST